MDTNLLSPTKQDLFAPLQRSRTALLTTYRRNGQGIGTPVTIMLIDPTGGDGAMHPAWESDRPDGEGYRPPSGGSRG
jgi:hypothetical protein